MRLDRRRSVIASESCRLKYILMVPADSGPNLHLGGSAMDVRNHRNAQRSAVSAQQSADWRDRQMQTQRKHRRGGSIPVIVAVFVAVVGQALVLFNYFGPAGDSPSSGSATMIKASAVSRAGAIEIPSGPPAGRPTI